MSKILSLVLLFFSFSVFAAQFDLDQERLCRITQFNRGPYFNGPVPAGYFVHTSESDTLSISDLINDQFLYFTVAQNTPIDFRMQYVWRYGGQAQLVGEDNNSSAYLGQSIMGPITMLFTHMNGYMDVSYILQTGEVLFRMNCTE